MNRQEARAIALRAVAGIAHSSPGSGYTMTDNDDDEDKCLKEFWDILEELNRRADRIEANLAIKPKRRGKR